MKWISGLLCLVVGMTLGSCQSDDELQSSAQTGFLISLTDEFNQKVTRTTPEKLEKPVTSQFKLRVTDADSGKEAYAGQCTESVLLKAGSYDLTATFGENPVIALDAPYYMGTKENQKVEEDKMTAVTIPCSVANALLSVTFDEESLKKVFEDYYVTVSVGGESVNVDAISGKSAYFRADSSVELTFHGFMLGTGKEVTYDIPEPESEEESGNGIFTAIPAKTHVQVTLKLDGFASTGAGISISKLEVNTISIGETLPLEMMPKPKIESTDFVNNELSFAETETRSAVINLKLSSPLQDLKLKFNSTDAKFVGLIADKEYVLSNADDKVAVETVLGITLPEIGVSEGSLDFSSLIPQLMTDAGNTVSSTVEVDVKANNRWASEDEVANRVYTLKCNKPEFSISVDERNCWAREFTIDEVEVTAGNAETIKNNLVYQYFDGAEWKDCITREAVKGRTQQFEQRAEEIQNKVYKVRALYRGVIASAEAEATLETPVQLPNSGMEEWHYSGTFSHNVRSYYPYAENGESFWATNNDYTTRYRQNTFGYPYNCFPAVSYVPGRGEGWAAELRNTGSGAGNEVDSWFTDDFVDNRNRVAGILFVGDFSCKTGVSATNYSYTKTDGKPFDVRPSILKFWYKYLPYNSDTWQVKIQLLDENKTPLVEETFQSNLSIVNDYQKVEVKLDYKEGQCYNKCKYIYIIFQSTINEGENMPFEWYKPEYILWKDNEQVKYEEPHVGSVLTIDDISLVYDK